MVIYSKGKAYNPAVCRSRLNLKLRLKLVWYIFHQSNFQEFTESSLSQICGGTCTISSRENEEWERDCSLDLWEGGCSLDMNAGTTW